MITHDTLITDAMGLHWRTEIAYAAEARQNAEQAEAAYEDIERELRGMRTARLENLPRCGQQFQAKEEA